MPLSAYIGPGAGFAFLSIFLVLFLTFILAVFIASWLGRFGAVWRLVRGRQGVPGQPGGPGRDRRPGRHGPRAGRKIHGRGQALRTWPGSRTRDFTAGCRPRPRPSSPVAWSSFMTGAEPSKHNIYDFLSRDPKTYLPDLSSARIGPARSGRFKPGKIPRFRLSKPVIQGLRQSVPFWKILGRQRRSSSTVLRVPITFPAGEVQRATCLSGMCAPDLKGSQGTFAFYTSDPAKIQKTRRRRRSSRSKSRTAGSRRSSPGRRIRCSKSRSRSGFRCGSSSTGRGASTARSRSRAEDSSSCKPGEFSPWIRLTFKPGLGIKIRAHRQASSCHERRASFRDVRHPAQHRSGKARPAHLPPVLIYSVYLGQAPGPLHHPGRGQRHLGLERRRARTRRNSSNLTYANHDEWERMFFNALAKTRRGFAVRVFETTDSLSHMLWRYLDKGHLGLAQAGPPR
ncbi:MAG: alkaline phosphatase family protein [Candidatus Moduliflexus flocculans]|nr:alkaline phosphatase family protein [Candidatus Moduliflexus flocculans]